MRFGGAAFVLWCALQAARRAWRGGAGLRQAPGAHGWGAALSATAALTWLNPHVYLDTVVLLGAVGAQQPAALRGWFAAGAGMASLMWFSLLGFGASALAPRLASPRTWRAIDAGVALVMGFVGLQLLLRPL
ncbi:MAG: LysE family transporter, partial [Pseudomonadota bacterium]